MLSAVQRLQARFAARELGPCFHVTRNSLDLLLAETSDRDADVARRTGTRMAQHITRSVGAVRILLLLADLTTAVRQDQVAVRWLCEASTVALVSWQTVLRIAKVAIWTCPTVEREKFLRSLVKLLVGVTVVAIIIVGGFAFLLFLIADVLLKRLVKLLDPLVNATHVERCVTLLTIPDGGTLVNKV